MKKGLGARPGDMSGGETVSGGRLVGGRKLFAIWRAKKRGDGPAGGGVSGAVAWVF